MVTYLALWRAVLLAVDVSELLEAEAEAAMERPPPPPFKQMFLFQLELPVLLAWTLVDTRAQAVRQ